MWYEYKLDPSLISDPIKTGSGPFERETVFITLPENDIYPAGYGFFLSFKLISWGDTVSIPDDLKVDLQMSPSSRVSGQRYKRYKLTGSELVETVLEQHKQQEEAQAQAEQARLDKKNRKIYGRVVWGWYRGNRYTDAPDAAPDCFFYNGSRYSSDKREKVANVDVHVVIAEHVSKYSYEQSRQTIRDRMDDWQTIAYAIAALRKVQSPDAGVYTAVSELENAQKRILAILRDALSGDPIDRQPNGEANNEPSGDR